MNIFYELISFVFIWSSLGFLISRLIKRNDIADLLWGVGFFVIAFIQIYLKSKTDLRSLVVFSFICLWSLRLTALFIFRLAKKEEDQRYKAWRESWGNSEPIYAFLQVFLLQTTLLVIVSFPIVWISYSIPSKISYWDFLGAVLAILGLVIETVADKQLSNFKKAFPKENIMDKGLWGLCRHPNYLGEILFWWGIFFFTMSVNKGIATICSPLLITFLLTKVSGSPMLEKFLAKKGELFEQYKKKVTRKIIPFDLKDLSAFLLLIAILSILDGIWLGYLLQDFYIKETKHIALIVGNSWQPVMWAVVGVYFCIALGIFIFAIKRSTSSIESFFYGSIFGLIGYGIYEFTNIALLKDWPIDMALIDIIWGPILCGTSAFLTKFIMDKFTFKS
jgi:steroid 5-alpha reductase family enzyme/uncharacterized membrane protein